MRLCLLLLSLLCAFALLAAPALADTIVTTSGTDLTVTAAAEVPHDVTVSAGDANHSVRIADASDTVTSSDPACIEVVIGSVDCPVTGRVSVTLGDGDDTLTSTVSTPVPIAVDGGGGGDTFLVKNGLAGDDVTCGDGDDDASQADRGDTVADDCENVPDTVPPDTSILTHPDSPTASATANFTFDATEQPSTFECSLDGAPFAGCAATPSFTGLGNGTHHLEVRATDAVRNIDLSPATFDWTVDTIAPAASFTATPAALTNSATPAFAVAVSEPSTFECALDGAAFESCSATPTFRDLADGPHSLLVRTTDAVGNRALTGPYTWTQDTLRPQTQLTSGPAASVPDNSTRAALTFASTDGVRFECSLDSGEWQACASPATYTNLANGTHTFAVRAVDAAGNPDGTPATRTWTVRIEGAPTARIAVTRDGDGFALSAAGSRDPDGGALIYRWMRNGQPAGATASVHYDAPAEATRDVFTLTVVDPSGERGQATAAMATRETTETTAHEAIEVVRFGSGTRLAAGARARIAALRAAMAAGRSTVRIEGFSRPAGDAAKVAKARAQAVRRLLVKGIKPAPAVTVAGRAAAASVGSNATSAGRARNDRVVVTVRFSGPATRLLTEQEGNPAVNRASAPQALAAASGAAPKLFAFYSAVPGALRRLQEVGPRVDVLAPNWYTLQPVSAAISGGTPNAQVMSLSRTLGFAVWPVVNATMHGSALIDSPGGRKRVVDAITALAAKHELAGVTLDMEEMLPRQKAAYSALVAQLASALHAQHRKLAAYAVRRTATDVDDSAAAYDWTALARAADLVLASGYNEHAATTAPGPISTQAGFAALASYAAATSRTKVAPTIGAFGYQWSGGSARMISSADAERRWPVAPEVGSADGVSRTTGATRTFFESAEDLWAREQAVRRAGSRWIGLFTLGREPERFWERSSIR